MAEELKIKLKTTSVAGTDDYNLMFNKPKINGVEVAGEKSLDDYDIKSKSEANAEHAEINAAISAETKRAQTAEKAIPSKVSELANDSGYQTADEVSDSITSAINAITDADSTSY